jgi:hypothetical protein
MEFMIVWEQLGNGPIHQIPRAQAYMLIQRMPNGTYQLTLPPLPANRLLIGILWVAPLEFVYLATIYMDDFVMRRAGWQ